MLLKSMKLLRMVNFAPVNDVQDIEVCEKCVSQ